MNYFSVSLGQRDFNNIDEFVPASFEKRWLYNNVAQPQKRNFSIEKSIRG